MATQEEMAFELSSTTNQGILKIDRLLKKL